MAKVLIGGRPSKSVLGRMKVVTVAVSIAAFLGSLGVIAGSGTTGTSVATTQPASQIAFNDSTSTTTGQNSSGPTSVQQPAFAAPVTRSRGS